MRFLLIDNYDSFTYNLVHLFGIFGVDIEVARNDMISPEGIEALAPDWICLSPGPKTPAFSGICKDVVKKFSGRVPILGVCLGMQIINEVFGGRTVYAEPVHGKCSMINHDGRGLFNGVPSPFKAARYHSLMVETGSQDIIETAHADGNVVMAIKHRYLPVAGVQFHPESFMSSYGNTIAENFLMMNEQYAPGREMSHAV